jgi:hypothetical protein
MNHPESDSNKVERDFTVAQILGRLKISEFVKFGAACLVVLGTAFSLGASQERWPFSSARQANAVKAPTAAEPKHVYYGYYGDLQDDRTTKIGEEWLEIEFVPNSLDVKAKSSGEVVSG